MTFESLTLTPFCFEKSSVRKGIFNEVITVWCLKWNMEISPYKTEVMVFPPPNTPTPKVKMNINDKDIKQLQHKKVLGILVDENLDFNLHIQGRKIKALNL